MRNIIYIIVILCFLSCSQAFGLTQIKGGWSASGTGEFTTSGMSQVSAYGGSDPSITLGITSSSSIYNGGSASDSKTGSQSVSITVGGYTLSIAYDGTVTTSIDGKTGATGAANSFIGSSATGLSTGGTSYDIFGSTDVNTDGYLYGNGTALASASGSASYDVLKTGTPSEAWGQITGSTSMRLEGDSTSSYVSTGGYDNGLHTESRARLTINGTQTLIGGKFVPGALFTSSSSYQRAYASVVNQGRVNVTSEGTAQGGAWGPSSKAVKSRLVNEDSASSAVGKLRGFVESNSEGDAADMSAIVQAEASTEKGFSATGGTGTYAATTQSSSSRLTYAEAFIDDSSWGSVSRNLSSGQEAVEYGKLENQGSGSQSYESGSDALSFAVVDMASDYDATTNTSTGHMRIDTFSQATKGKKATPGSVIDKTGNATAYYSDPSMFNIAYFEGGLFHYSYINTSVPMAQTLAVLTEATVDTYPKGNETLIQPYFGTTSQDPNVAWSRTEGTWRNPP
jgi:hypothetical protein